MPVTLGRDVAGEVTAWQLLQRLDPQPGEAVLVHNASGGVGQFAVQLAVHAGARVIGTASPVNHDHLRTEGVEPVAYGEGLVQAVRDLSPQGVDVVADLIGGDALAATQELLAPAGRFGSITDAATTLARGGSYVFVQPSPSDLAAIASLIDQGHLHVDVAATYRFDDAVAAYRRLEDGHVRGMIVLTP